MLMPLSNEGVIDVYVYTDVLTQAEIDALQHHSVHLYHADRQFHTVYAAVAIDALETIAALPFVRWVSLPSYSLLRTGDVTSAGDTVLRAAEARENFGVDGRGVRVGIISDSLVNLQASVDSGDLPSDVIVLEAGEDSGTDEGRAMAEIIHDIAPGAKLLFHSGFDTSVAYDPTRFAISSTLEQMLLWMISASPPNRSLSTVMWRRQCRMP